MHSNMSDSYMHMHTKNPVFPIITEFFFWGGLVVRRVTDTG